MKHYLLEIFFYSKLWQACVAELSDIGKLTWNRSNILLKLLYIRRKFQIINMIAWLLYTLHDILRILSFSWFHLNKCLMLLNGSMRVVPSRKDFFVAVSTWTVRYFFASITIYEIIVIINILIAIIPDCAALLEDQLEVTQSYQDKQLSLFHEQ